MRRNLLLIACSCLVNGLFAHHVVISTPHTSLVLSASQGEELKYIYYGEKLSDTDLKAMEAMKPLSVSAYPVYGLNCPSETALSVKHDDGNMTLQMKVASVVETWTEISHQEKKPVTYAGINEMANGLELPYNHVVDKADRNEYSSRVLQLKKVGR